MCRRCRSVFLARPQERDGRRFSAGTRPAFYFDVVGDFALRPAEGSQVLSREDLLHLQECLPTESTNRPNLRQHNRHQILAPVTVMRLAADLRISHEPRSAIAVNVSAGGMAIMVDQPLAEPFFAIDFAVANTALTPVVLEKLRSRPTETGFEIAGKFVSRIEY